MYFDSFSEFLAMGGHGLYVWMAYGVFLAVIVWNLWMLRSNRRRCIQTAQKTWKRENLKTDKPGNVVEESE